MDDYMDDIVNEAREHKVVLDDLGQPDLAHSAVVAGVVFARCAKGCNLSIGNMGNLNLALSVWQEAEIRHQLYVAITGAEEHERTLWQRAAEVRGM